MTIENVAVPATADDDSGPELKRTLGQFQVFAISFAFISVAVGIFATYDDLLGTAGPVGIWLWVIAAVGQTLVALVVAQFAARIALSGSSYQWASRLANPKIGWLFGWLTFWYLATGVVAMDNALASQAFMPLVGMPESEDTARMITVAILIVQAVLVIASTRLLGLITSAAVGTRAGHRRGAGDRAGGRHAVHRQRRRREPHLPRHHRQRARLLRHRRRVDGRDDHGPAHARRLRLRGEPRRGGQGSVPQRPARDRVLGRRGRSAGAGVPDRAHRRDQGHPGSERQRVTGRRDHPRSARTGRRANPAGGPGVRDVRCRHGGDGRLLTAGVRDGARSTLPGARADATGQPATQTPVPATILILVVGVVLMLALPGQALLQLIIGGTILPALIYGAIVILYLAVRKRLEHKEGGFSLGRFEMPIAIAALIWVAAALFVLVTPGDATVPTLVVLGLILAGGVYFAYMLIFHREVLDTEPGEGNPVAATLPRPNDLHQPGTDRADRTSRPSWRHRLPGGEGVGWNLLFTHEPAMIVFAQETQDVVNALAWARQHDVPLRVRSGGHCLEGWSSVDDGIVIDVSEMKSVTMRPGLQHRDCRRRTQSTGGRNRAR